MVGASDAASRRERIALRGRVVAVPAHGHMFDVDREFLRVVEREGDRARRRVAAREGGRVFERCRCRGRADGDRGRGRGRGEARAGKHVHHFGRVLVVRDARVVGVTAVGGVPLVAAGDRAGRRERVALRGRVFAVPAHGHMFDVDREFLRVVEREGDRARRRVAAREGGRVFERCRCRGRADGDRGRGRGRGEAGHVVLGGAGGAVTRPGIASRVVIYGPERRDQRGRSAADPERPQNLVEQVRAPSSGSLGTYPNRGD